MPTVLENEARDCPCRCETPEGPEAPRWTRAGSLNHSTGTRSCSSACLSTQLPLARSTSTVLFETPPERTETRNSSLASTQPPRAQVGHQQALVLDVEQLLRRHIRRPLRTLHALESNPLANTYRARGGRRLTECRQRLFDQLGDQFTAIGTPMGELTEME
jgi:hypothetical protein